VWVALTLQLLGPGAHAQPRDPIAAEALFRAGRESYEKGEYTLALQRFDEAYRLDPTPGALLNRALSEEALGQLARAWQDYRRVLERLDVADPRVDIAHARVRGLEARLAWVTIELESGAPAGTTVKRGDVELGAASLGVALPFDPGQHELVVTAPGHPNRPYALSLAEGERRALRVAPLDAPPAERPAPSALVSDVALAERPPPSKPAAPPAALDSRAPPTAGYVLLGVGAAGIALAAVSGVVVLDRIGTVEDNCVNKRCNDAGLEAGRSGRTWRAVAGVALAVGVGAGVGGYLVLASDRSTAQVAWKTTF
jgi:hypothetical protein